ncbi:MAG: hypothetical protein MUC97_18085 [Bernardetiaceae bacterium]|jgi:hypothetical protein|nr:hypothetical protein [Bernardetiaceae bacterium]
MPKLIAIDRRLISRSYRGSVGTARQYLADHVFACDATTPLSEFIAFVRRYATAGTRNWLEIWCHGNEYEGQMGYGLQFCREMISHSATCGGTVGQLGALHGRVWHTVLRVCGAAHISSRAAAASSDGVCSIDDFGDGHALCSTMARTLGSSLEASTELQAFFTAWRSSWFSSDSFIPGSIDFGHREGLWVEYDQGGNLLPSRSSRHVSAYRDGSGATIRPGGGF